MSPPEFSLDRDNLAALAEGAIMTESTDADRVDQAIDALIDGDLARAQSLLLAVIANTPDDYAFSYEKDGELCIEFWTLPDFLHYATWDRDEEAEQQINWTPNAYPRAFYYMGFLCVKLQRYDMALAYLQRGMTLEPQNPKFLFESAQALFRMGRVDEAFELYERVTDLSPFVTPADLATGLRGRGFILIERGELDTAEAFFIKSLQLDPDSEVARNELDYIKHLRRGGDVAPAAIVETQAGAQDLDEPLEEDPHKDYWN